MCEYSFNPYLNKRPAWQRGDDTFLARNDMLEFHRSLDGYAPTPLRALPELAQSLGVRALYVKDESWRFGVKAFKPLGASYAIYRFLKEVWEERFDSEFTPQGFKDQQVLEQLGTFTFCAATDGNHGRAVAWTASRLGQRAVIYLPQNSAPARVEAIRGEGAEAVLVAGTFDDCVKRCADDAQANGWQVIADTAYPGYMEVPKNIVLGYSSIFRELEDSINERGAPAVDIVLVQAGVGGLAAAATSYYLRRYAERGPQLVCVEPGDSDCFLESIRFGGGEPLSTRGKLETMMAGLACGTPSLVAWPIVRDGMDLFISCPDHYAVQAMRAYHREGITAGESGAAGLAGLLALLRSASLRKAQERLGLGGESRILLINTEGDTDPVNYRKIIGEGARAWPST